MSQHHVDDLKEKARTALSRSLGQVRATALVAALVPLASMAITPAVADARGTGGMVPSPCDFATSGGFVIADSGAKVTFGAHGGCKNGTFKGSLTFSDHGLDYHVDMVEITGYLVPDGAPPVARDICGIARSSNPVEGLIAFRIRLEDNDEPGITDRFGIVLSNSYSVSTRLLGDGGPGGGNVQLHAPNKTNVGPASPPDVSAMCFNLPMP